MKTTQLIDLGTKESRQVYSKKIPKEGISEGPQPSKGSGQSLDRLDIRAFNLWNVMNNNLFAVVKFLYINIVLLVVSHASLAQVRGRRIAERVLGIFCRRTTRCIGSRQVRVGLSSTRERFRVLLKHTCELDTEVVELVVPVPAKEQCKVQRVKVHDWEKDGSGIRIRSSSADME
jgi:hypothetical protein